MSKKAALLILDGWGIGEKNKSDGVYIANTPCFDHLINKYPNSKLVTYGSDVGLPNGQMGNSEVGHLNIGAGRIVYQDLLRINNAIDDKSFFNNSTINNAIDYAEKKGVKIHLMGLVSKGGVHSSLNHLIALCDLFHNKNVKDVFIHAFTDGRDCNPNSALSTIKELNEKIENTHIKIASVIGRYYAMDRDQRWERIKKAYDLLIHGKGNVVNTAIEAINKSYKQKITDEFIEPYIIKADEGKISENDVVLCFNFRTDRCRQITSVLTQLAIKEYSMNPISLHYLTMTNYDKAFNNIHVIYDKENLKNTLGEVLSNNKKTQLRIAETEKYPHVTYFFNGGRESPFSGEEREMANSPKVPTYDLKPEMSAHKITKMVTSSIKEKKPDFICLNFANPDMVGHTGVPKAIIKACETVDSCLNQVLKVALENNYTVVVIADHGNADKMFHPDGSPHTAHTLNLVPMVVVDDAINSVKDGVLADVAPTILSIMGLNQPEDMTGKSLV
ncbi:MAG: phosphoglycerate mutase (2,3-diphosphoglycerate-independent) [Crocinitomicaceae bacterium]|nr:phosphoglycerate mutase (2,3-diphosphoglycerate-independent) [Crocinitomicaceae bacterium]